MLDLGNQPPADSQLGLTFHSWHCAKPEVMIVRCAIMKMQAFVIILGQGTLRAAASDLQ